MQSLWSTTGYQYNRDHPRDPCGRAAQRGRPGPHRPGVGPGEGRRDAEKARRGGPGKMRDEALAPPRAPRGRERERESALRRGRRPIISWLPQALRTSLSPHNHNWRSQIPNGYLGGFYWIFWPTPRVKRTGLRSPQLFLFSLVPGQRSWGCEISLSLCSAPPLNSP